MLWEMNIDLAKYSWKGRVTAGLFRAGQSEGQVGKRWVALVALVKARALCQPREESVQCYSLL